MQGHGSFLDGEDLRAMQALVRRFAREVEATLFVGEAPDGDLARVPALLARARSLELLADPAPGAPGHDLGVWGRHCLDEGAALSLHTLALLAESCAGFASAVHTQGLACLALHGTTHALPAGTHLAVACMPAYGLPLGRRGDDSGLSLAEQESRARLDGTAHFALSAAEPAAIVCFATSAGPSAMHDSTSPGDAQVPTANGGWAAILLETQTPRLSLAPTGRRTGLRAAHQFHVSCDGVDVLAAQVLAYGSAARDILARVLACDWLGQAAIALGAARRALRDARAYAAERYQGGEVIVHHPAVQLLLGTVELDTALLDAIVHRNAGTPLAALDGASLLRWAAAARLAAGENAHRAITNCLQVLGGYGYMEDYGMEKRLRDVSVIKSLHGAPDQLRLLLSQLGSREGEP